MGLLPCLSTIQRHGFPYCVVNVDIRLHTDKDSQVSPANLVINAGETGKVEKPD
jgi:hypothetical protein